MSATVFRSFLCRLGDDDFDAVVHGGDGQTSEFDLTQEPAVREVLEEPHRVENTPSPPARSSWRTVRPG